MTRVQLERARHDAARHGLVGCAQCLDPLRGLLPADALPDGPRDVWH